MGKKVKKYKQKKQKRKPGKFPGFLCVKKSSGTLLQELQICGIDIDQSKIVSCITER
jgi:hypothetical protein